MRYRSSFEILGLPFVHVETGRVDDEGRFRRGIARGWIAVGDVAFGVVFSMGGFALGGIAVGGLAIGGLAFAGAAMGAFSLGGLAIGWVAMGGLALGAHAALGGAAIAKSFAIGGLAVAEHANDAAAESYFDESRLRFARFLLDHSRWLLLLTLVPVLARFLRSKGTNEAS